MLLCFICVFGAQLCSPLCFNDMKGECIMYHMGSLVVQSGV